MSTALYPIRAVARLTGLPLDTLRAWERRYGAVRPKRDARGRLYSEAHVLRLRRLRELVDRGHPIGQVARLGDADLQKLLGTDGSPVAAPRRAPARNSDALIEPVVAAVDAFDYTAADRELSRLAALLAPRDLIHRVALPLMRTVGENWHKGKFSVAQEHMTSALLRNLLGGLLRLYASEAPRVRIVFATPAGEHHDFGLLAAAMLAAGQGIGVIYLGPNLPAEEVARAVRQCSPAVVLIGVSGTEEPERAIAEIERLTPKIPPKTELWIGGTLNEKQLARATGHPIVFVPDFEHLETQLRRVGAR